MQCSLSVHQQFQDLDFTAGPYAAPRDLGNAAPDLREIALAGEERSRVPTNAYGRELCQVAMPRGDRVAHFPFMVER